MGTMRSAARVAAKLAYPAIYVWAGLSPKPNPLLTSLMRASGVSVRKHAKLVTGQSMLVNPFDKVGREILKHGCFEPETVAYVRSVLKPGMTFVDIGANIGQYTVIAAQSVQPAGHVHAFEPHPVVHKDLRRNVGMSASKSVWLHEVALSNSKGTAELYVGHSDNAGANSLKPTINTLQHTVTIQTDTMDTVLGHVQKIDLMKIDVEGAELLVLRGGEKTIERTRPILIMEFSDQRFTGGFGYSNADIVEWLKERGYKLFHIRPDGLHPYNGDMGDGWENVACLPS